MNVLWVAIAVVLDGAVALAGGLLPEHWLSRHRANMLGFAAGALLAAAILDLLPEALAASGITTLPWLIGGIVVLALAEWALAGHQRRHGIAPYAILTSDALHNFGDGVAIAAAFASSSRLGVITSLAVLVHELPEEIADYAILRSSKIAKRRALIALALVQLTAGLGAAATLLGIGVTGANGPVLALSAGTFLYIALVELLPGAGIVGLLLGIATIALL